MVLARPVSVLELGFRSLNSSKYLGPFAYSTDDYLRTLSLPANARIAVMANARELLDTRGARQLRSICCSARRVSLRCNSSASRHTQQRRPCAAI